MVPAPEAYWDPVKNAAYDMYTMTDGEENRRGLVNINGKVWPGCG